MNRTTEHTLALSDGVITYTLTRKRVKNINLRVHADGRVTVSAPPRVPLSAIEAFLRGQERFFKNAEKRRAAALAKLPKPLTLSPGVLRCVRVERSDQNGVALTDDALTLCVKDPTDAILRYRVFTAFFERRAARVLTARAAALYPLFSPRPASFPVLKFRTMKTKWGVCRPQQGTVTLNRNLLFLPDALVDYVICHEFVHFRHPDHSPAFWRELARFVPDCKEKRKALSDFPVPVFAASLTERPRAL